MTPSQIVRRIAPTAALAVALGLCAAANAQQRDSLTLYELPDYRGASVTFYGDNANIGSTGFTNRAQSAQVIGTWRLCSGGGFRDRCETLSRNARDLSVYGLSGQIGSAQRLANGGYAAAPAYPAGREPAPRPDYATRAPRYTEQAPRYEAPQGYPLPPAQPRTAPMPSPRYGSAAAPAEGYDGPDPYRGGRGAQPAPDYSYDGGRTYRPSPEPRYDETGPGYRGAGAAEPLRDDVPRAMDAPRQGFDGPAVGDMAGVPGSTVVFFARPESRGADVAASGQGGADAFCRSQGLGPAVYFDQTQRARRATDAYGRIIGPGPVLRDVLCRRF
jgi:hypothetical protein